MAGVGVLRHERGIFAALLLLHLIPIWLAGPLVTQDGPSHLSNAWILLRLATGECPIVSDLFVANWRLSPNWLAHFALAALGVALPPVAAEKVLQSLCVAALPLAGHRAIAAIDPNARPLALALFPLALAFPLAMGFYGFCLGMALALWLYGSWARDPEHPRLARLGLGGAVAFFVHPLPLALAVGLVALGGAALALREISAGGRRGAAALASLGLRHAAAPLALALPAALLSLGYLSTSSRGGTLLWLPWSEKVLQLASGYSLVGYGWGELVFATVWVWTVAALAIRALRSRPTHPLRGGLAAAGAVLLALAILTPEASPRVGVLTDRVAVALFAVLVLLGATAGLPRHAGAFAALLATCALGLLATKGAAQVELAAVVREYLAVGPELRAESTLLPIHLRVEGPLGDRSRSPRIDPFVHASGYLAAQGCVVGLSNYEATLPAVFPARFRPELDPYVVAHYDEYAPESTDLAGYERRTGRAIDQVYVWGGEEDVLREDPARRATLRALLARIDADYELVFTTPGSGAGRLYRRRGAAPARR